MTFQPWVKKSGKILGGIVAVGFVIALIFEWATPTKEDAKLDQESKRVELQQKQAQEARYRAAYEAARLEALKPARSARCRGIAPAGPTILTSDEKTLNPPDDEGSVCDLVYAVTKGEVEFDGPGGKFVAVAGTSGRTTEKPLVKARAASDTAEMYYMLCPRGMGPDNGGWTCKREGLQSDVRQAGLQFGVFFK